MEPLVLVVDDEAAIRDLLTFFLTGEGFRVRAAAHGGEALALLRGGVCPAVVLLDLKMPICGGGEVLESLAADPGYRDLPVVVISGGAEVAPRLRTSAVHRILIKPFDLGELLDAIHAAIETAGEAAALR